jgi:hypothetical protein
MSANTIFLFFRSANVLLCLVACQCLFLVSPAHGGGCNPGSFGPSAINLLLLRADTDNSWAAKVKTEIENTAIFDSIEDFDARSQTPTLSFLQRFGAVLVWATGTEFSSPSGLGNVLADYWDGGGAVVAAMFAHHRSRIQGRFGNAANGYLLMDGSWPAHLSDKAGLGEVDQHELLGLFGK